jgi:hypothetical protein
MDKQMTIDLKKLREVAEKATPGPWLYRGKSASFHSLPEEGTAYTYGPSIMEPEDNLLKDQDAEFIATFNPQTILALLDAYEAIARDAEILRKGVEAVSCLIDNSHGVSGLHLNGDDAPWAELREGGRFETWLLAFDEATATRHATQGD